MDLNILQTASDILRNMVNNIRDLIFQRDTYILDFFPVSFIDCAGSMTVWIPYLITKILQRMPRKPPFDHFQSDSRQVIVQAQITAAVLHDAVACFNLHVPRLQHFSDLLRADRIFWIHWAA